MADLQAPPRAPAARGGAELHALVRSQGRTIAIPGACVTQAVEAPAALTQVPRRAGAIAGVMTIGRRLLPVVSLARWLEPAALGDSIDTPSAGGAPGLVLLLTDGTACIGLAVEAVLGVQRFKPDQMRRLFHDDNPQELFQRAALFGDDDTTVGILEPDRLMALAGVWVAEAALDGDEPTNAEAATQAARASVAPRSATVAHATFRIADVHVALPADHIGELMRRPPLRRELLAHDGVLGLCDWRGRVVPVVDLAGALHALPTDDDEARWVCIVCEGDLAIGIVVHEVLAIARIAADAGTLEHAPEAERSVVARRLVSDERLLQLIDVAALLRRYPETAISARGAQARQLRQAADAAAPAYMVFDAGGMFAAQIDGVQEVVALPDALRPRLEAGISASLQWREQPVPVMAIADTLVTLPAPAARQLVIVRQDGRFAALPIAGVKAMVPRGAARRNRMRVQGRPVDVISVDIEDHRASYPVVDLCGALRAPA